MKISNAKIFPKFSSLSYVKINYALCPYNNSNGMPGIYSIISKKAVFNFYFNL